MVLVRRRNEFVGELLRALKQRDIPVAGADRLVLTEQLAVQDLVALGRFLLLPEDDLTLATVLKGPLFGIDEEMLFDLAYDRGSEKLWQRLRARAGKSPQLRRVAERLSGCCPRWSRPGWDSTGDGSRGVSGKERGRGPRKYGARVRKTTDRDETAPCRRASVWICLRASAFAASSPKTASRTS